MKSLITCDFEHFVWVLHVLSVFVVFLLDHRFLPTVQRHAVRLIGDTEIVQCVLCNRLVTFSDVQCIKFVSHLYPKRDNN